MKKITIVLLTWASFHLYAGSQGCVAVRNMSGFGQYNCVDNAFSAAHSIKQSVADKKRHEDHWHLYSECRRDG